MIDTPINIIWHPWPFSAHPSPTPHTLSYIDHKVGQYVDFIACQENKGQNGVEFSTLDEYDGVYSGDVSSETSQYRRRAFELAKKGAVP